MLTQPRSPAWMFPVSGMDKETVVSVIRETENSVKHLPVSSNNLCFIALWFFSGGQSGKLGSREGECETRVLNYILMNVS